MSNLMTNVRGEGLERSGPSNRVRDPRALSPTLGSPYMMSRASLGYRLGRERLRTRLNGIMRREEDHVIIRAKRHEL